MKTSGVQFWLKPRGRVVALTFEEYKVLKSVSTS